MIFEKGIRDLVLKRTINKSETITDNNIQKLLQVLTDWPTQYGLSNLDEFYATAIEHFFKLPKMYRNKIIQLMM
jgi:hypothetical protein